jgi:hypothetical protein
MLLALHSSYHKKQPKRGDVFTSPLFLYKSQMKAKDLYALPPIRTSKELWSYIQLFPNFNSNDFQTNECAEIEERFYAENSYDGERCFILSVLAFNNKPFAILQKAGRGGSDHKEIFITCKETYLAALAKLQELIDDPIEIIDENKDIPELTAFYNDTLEAYYDPNLKPKYKVGDIVLATVPENHLDYKTKYIQTRVRIDRVSPVNPTDTYHGLQLDRSKAPWKIGHPVEYIDAPNAGTIYASFSDKEIVE